MKDKHSHRVKVLYLYSYKWINCKSGTIVTDLQKLDTEQQLYVFTYSCSEHLYPIMEQQQKMAVVLLLQRKHLRLNWIHQVKGVPVKQLLPLTI